jgi:hypothetical protein
MIAPEINENGLSQYGGCIDRTGAWVQQILFQAEASLLEAVPASAQYFTQGVGALLLSAANVGFNVDVCVFHDAVSFA